MSPTNDARSDQPIMPFLVCQSHGGPLDDDAFHSGWRLSQLHTTLADRRVAAVADCVRPHECLQADLIAMAHGYTMRIEPGGDDVWVPVTFIRAA